MINFQNEFMKADAYNAIHRSAFKRKFGKAKDHICLRCGDPAKDWHHYMGYTFEHQTDVIPLCATCHSQMNDGIRKRTGQKAYSDKLVRERRAILSACDEIAWSFFQLVQQCKREHARQEWLSNKGQQS